MLNDAFDLFAALGASDEQLDFPAPLRQRQAGLGGRRTWPTPHESLAPLFDLIVAHVPPPAAEARADEPAQPAGGADRGRPVPRPPAHRPRRVRARSTPGMAIRALSRDGKEIERGRITKLLAFRGLKRQPIDEALAGDIVAVAGLSKATVADTLGAPEVPRRPAGPADRPADHRHHRLGQRQPAGRPRRRQGAEPGDPRAPAARGRGQRRHQGRRDRRQGRLRGRRPRRAAAGRADRDHAPRGLRGLDQPPARGLPDRSGDRRAAGADRGGGDRRRRRLRRRGHREALGPQGRAEGHGPVRRRQDPAHLPGALARADRLPGRVPDRHPRLRRAEPRLLPLRALQGRDRGPPQRRAGLQLRRRDWPPTRCGTWRTAA